MATTLTPKFKDSPTLSMRDNKDDGYVHFDQHYGSDGVKCLGSYLKSAILNELGAVDKGTFDAVVNSRVEALNAQATYWMPAEQHGRLIDEERSARRNAELERDTAIRDVRALKARLEAAESRLERVRAARNEWSKTIGRTGHVAEIDEALGDVPPFNLPSEAGVEFTARDELGMTVMFCSVWNTSKELPDTVLYVNANNYAYTGKDVMESFKDHRIVWAR
jgi:hypothetical protein